MPVTRQASKDLAQQLAEDAEKLVSDDYVRERRYPPPTSPVYLHSLDLCEAIRQFGSSEKIRILDYGCGGSPYRDFFPNSEYVRADFTPCQGGLDILLPEADSPIPVGDGSFDLVLSTQVLEHVADPAHYVAECFRVLKPGGFLLLTTHGLLMGEHGCPYDFQRWTADGLRLLLERAGFRIKKTQKLTCGARAICHVIINCFWMLQAPKSSLFGFAMWVLRRLHRLNPTWLNRPAEKYFKKFGVMDAAVDDNEDQKRDYIALLVLGERSND